MISKQTLRLAPVLAVSLFLATPALAAEAMDNGPVANEIANEEAADNSVLPPPSEDTLIFTGQDVKPLTPDNSGFSARARSVIADAKAISSIMGPTTWAILIGGFALLGLILRRSEQVLHFDTEAASRRTDRPEDPQADSDPGASTPPHSDSDPAPSARRDPVE